MDILKILTRGIKDPARRPGQAAAPSINLPSAGNKSNPQLFHDAVPSRKGKKRKRTKGGAEQSDNEEEDDVSDIDYFAPKKDPADEGEATAVAVEHSTEAQPKRKKAKLLPEDECRQILRSHRLKFTLLSGGPEDAAAKASKKSKKDEEPSKKSTKEKDKKQFYPQPLNSFTELQDLYDVSPKLVENIAKQAFKLPTEVQMASLPLLLKPKKALKHALDTDMANVKHGVDFVAVAPTGSGKTVTFMIPAIMSIIRSLEQQDCPPEEKEHKLQAIVVAPTHELAKQIVNEGRKLAMGTGVRIYSMQKGLQLGAEEIAPEEQDGDDSDDSDAENEESEHKAELEHKEDGADSDSGSGSDSDAEESRKNPRKTPRRAIKPDILVTTPKSLLNLLSSGTSKRALPSVTALILDEADVLLDPLFRKQTLAIWKSCTNPSLRLTFWSATMASNIESLIHKHTSRRATPPPLIRLVVGLKDTAVPNITHKLIYTATEPGKLLALRQLLHPSTSTSTSSSTPLRPPFLIFTQTIPRATALHAELKYDIPATAGGSSRIAVLHSSLSPKARSAVMTRFRQGDVWILITTDVLARGVDFAGVNGVVSYDVPSSAAAYVHRAGRTGRAGREGGVAVTFYTKEDIPFVRSVANVIAASEKQGGRSGEEGTVQKWLLDALPKVAKEDKRRLKVRGVEARRKDADKGRAGIGAKSSYDRRRENNRRGAIEGSKRRKRLEMEGGGREEGEKGDDGAWDGIDD
ncbi:P-loop containing nucleoside triphosphate hydrolase protein [Coniochaeta ligniaria NRRL 30616]|uniref:ATP-dependent RNA helicase n=1 Tax=Coniochaeta ligniaria NRRL 30616 TaxID=1408157 RepID=A0A1J7I910_9PEZI|nr:P-loop containing nucleoside triphosphate hydrolase protein [Coniochaeta ligniaria NRRL 30616]